MNLRRTVTTPNPGAAGDVGNTAARNSWVTKVMRDEMIGSSSSVQPSLGKTKTYGGWYGNPSDWFMDLFGFREVQYEDAQRRLEVRPDKDSPGCFVMEGENEKVYKVGRFSTPSLHELQKQALAKGGLGALPGRLRVVNMRGDVSSSIGDPDNRHATFQVASQFNCLEYVGPTMRPEYGVTMYSGDRTQGPACCIACGPACVYRNYFAQVDGGVGQRHNRQINNLRDLSEKLGNEPHHRFFRVEGGYTLATDRGLMALSSELDGLREEEYQALRRELRVGVHEDVQVTSMEWGTCPVLDEEQTVTQVLGSACSVSYSQNDRDLWEPMARLVLSASYEATLWAALLAALRHRGKGGSRRVFLTCLGGGVFGNESRWITDAMHEAFSKFKNCNLEVYIVTYSGPYDRHLVQLERDFCGK